MTDLLKHPPASMPKGQFIKRFGDVYEHSAWIAEAVFDAGLTEAHNSRPGLAAALKAVLDEASDEAKLTLIRAHPDLAGKAALKGDLTDASTSEQAGAGLDQCSPEELAEFQQLNTAYKSKFGFPFIVAVKGMDRVAVLEMFRTRLAHDQGEEFETALSQINKIALLRLQDL